MNNNSDLKNLSLKRIGALLCFPPDITSTQFDDTENASRGIFEDKVEVSMVCNYYMNQLKNNAVDVN